MSLTSSCPALRAAANFGLLTRSRLNFTSSAVKGVPSCHLTLLRSLMRQLSPSAEMPPFSMLGISAGPRPLPGQSAGAEAECQQLPPSGSQVRERDPALVLLAMVRHGALPLA